MITESVDSGPSCLHRLCPAVGCTLVVPEEFVEKYCSEKLTAYRNFQLESFVSQNKVGDCVGFCRVIVKLRVVYCYVYLFRGLIVLRLLLQLQLQRQPQLQLQLFLTSTSTLTLPSEYKHEANCEHNPIFAITHNTGCQLLPCTGM